MTAPAKEAANIFHGNSCQASRHVIDRPFIGAARKRQTFQICTAAMTSARLARKAAAFCALY